jgi:hypothetical protein
MNDESRISAVLYIQFSIFYRQALVCYRKIHGKVVDDSLNNEQCKVCVRQE